MSNYIFPPIVDTYQKAFVIGGDEISITENEETVTKSVIKIKYRVPATGGNTGSIEVSIRNQYNNLSVLKNGQDTITASPLIGPEDLYIYIPQSEVNIGLNQWYRIQLRYNDSGAYSEWSTVTLIKAISAPSITLGAPFDSNTVNSQSVTVQGCISFSDQNDDETLQSYEIELLREDAIIERSGVLYPDPFNARAIGPYQLKSTLQFLNEANYKLNIKYTTKGFYTNEPNKEDGSSVEFSYAKGDPKALMGDFFVTANNSKGYNEIQVGLYEKDYIQRNSEGEEIGGNKIFKIQRSSYRNNYTTRETLFTIDLTKYNGQYPKVPLKDPYAETDAQDTLFEHPASALPNTKTYDFSQVFADTTAEPGILYRYYLVDADGNDYEYRSGYSKNLVNANYYFNKNGCDFSTNGNNATLIATAAAPSVYFAIAPVSQYIDQTITVSCTALTTPGNHTDNSGTKYSNLLYLGYWGYYLNQENEEKYGWKSLKAVVLTPPQEEKEQKTSLAFTIPDDLYRSEEAVLEVRIFAQSLNKGETLKFKELQVEIGDKATDYEPYKSSTCLECMLDVEHIFFTDINSQFRLNLNPNISSFKYVVQESVTNTLGSAFPFVRRSGHTKYRQFSISGTICGYGDDEGIFLSKNSASLILSQGFYDRYKAKNRITPWNDYIFEKQYRDKAIEFLMDGKPKLFKSFTEGNMIVALTAVSFTPNKQLDRNVYDFSATVTEIAECTAENCQKYNCYENEAYKMFVPTEYYLVAVGVEMDENTVVPTQSYSPYYDWATKNQNQPGYLCVREVTNMLQAYSPSSELDEILANDSVIRGGTI